MELNCQSLKPIVHDFFSKIKTRNVDICFLNETWIKKPGDNLFTIARSYSYQLFHSKTYGKWKGTAILVSNTISFDRVITSSFDDFKSFDFVVLNLNKKVNTILACKYRYGGLGRAFDAFLSEFNLFCVSISVILWFSNYLWWL